jgi:kinetochore protein Spc25, fungi type
MHAQISNLKTHRAQLISLRDERRTELSSLQATLNARRDAQAKQARYLHSQARFNEPELGFWEEYLCMRIEGAGKEDRLKFVFSHVYEKDWQREAWFELDTSEREYKVLKTGPKVEKEDVDECLDRLNESRELGPFFKGMRDTFVKAMK